MWSTNHTHTGCGPHLNAALTGFTLGFGRGLRSHWFDAKGRTIGWPGDGGSESRDSAPEACIAVGSAGQALASVIAGLGTARVPYALAAEAIAAGTVTVEEGPSEGRRSYWLVAPPPQWRQKKVRALVQYLTGTL